MKLGRLLEFHQNNLTDLGLSKSLGDSFLLQHNPVFRSVRNTANELGFRYIDQMDSKYLALPLSQLETVLESKSIPYFDNVSVLFDIESKIKNVTTWDDITDNLKKNHVFHESCHGIARSAAEGIFKDELPSDRQILRLLIEESFANSCELLGIVAVEDTAHRIFYELNSYIFMFDDRTQLKRLISEIGYPATIRFLIFCYLFSNFLHEKMNESDFQELIKILKLQAHPTSTHKILRSVAKIAFELNPRFRWVTTTFYLRLAGLSISTTELNKIEFLKIMTGDPRFLTLIESLSHFKSI